MERLETVLHLVRTGIKDSVELHGDWQGYSPAKVCQVVSGEFSEYMMACVDKQIHGEHGQIDELLDLAIVAIKGVIHLQR